MLVIIHIITPFKDPWLKSLEYGSTARFNSLPLLPLQNVQERNGYKISWSAAYNLNSFPRES